MGEALEGKRGGMIHIGGFRSQVMGASNRGWKRELGAYMLLCRFSLCYGIVEAMLIVCRRGKKGRGEHIAHKP